MRGFAVLPNLWLSNFFFRLPELIPQFLEFYDFMTKYLVKHKKSLGFQVFLFTVLIPCEKLLVSIAVFCYKNSDFEDFLANNSEIFKKREKIVTWTTTYIVA